MKVETRNIYIKVKEKWVEIPILEGVIEIETNENTINYYIRKKKDKGENNMEDNKKPTEQRSLKKSDLKNGDIVELRNGERYVYIEDYIDWKFCDLEIYKKLINLGNGDDIRLSFYDDDLLYIESNDYKYDIMKILDMSELYKNPKWTLERKQEEMTLEEICRELGRNIKIVKEK